MNRLLLICGFAVAAMWIAVVAADPPNAQTDSGDAELVCGDSQPHRAIGAMRV
jgi:hypothetical protein